MIKTIKKLWNMKLTAPLLLSLMIAAQLVQLFVAVQHKEGCHSDEIFSYGLANSFYQPFLDNDDIRGQTLKEDNLFHWESGDIIRDYVTVREDQRFRYDSVWYNQSHDRHPPLYYTILHTMCSFFPGTFSFVFGYIINFCCFIVTQIFLYKLARNLLKSKFLALTACFFWGFSMGALSMTIYIRMYCMLAMWTTVFLYLQSSLYKFYLALPQGKITVKDLPIKTLVALFIVTLCGALTQYLFLFVAFVTVMCYLIKFIIDCRFKFLIVYGCVMLGAVIASMLIFPAYLPNMFKEAGSKVPNFFDQLGLGFKYLTDDLLPLSKSDVVFYLPTYFSVAVALVVMSIPVIFLLRDKKPVAKFIETIKSDLRSLKSVRPKSLLLSILNRFKKIHPISIAVIISIALIIALTAHSVDFLRMSFINRYFFVIYPAAALAVILILWFLLSWFRYKKILISSFLVFITLWHLTLPNETYLFKKPEDSIDVSALTKDANVIFVSAKYSEIWILNYLPAEMYDVGQIFATYLGVVPDNKDALAALDSDKPVYLFLNTPIEAAKDKYYIDTIDNKTGEKSDKKISGKELEEQYLSVFKNLPYAEKYEHIGDCELYFRPYEIYCLSSGKKK